MFKNGPDFQNQPKQSKNWSFKPNDGAQYAPGLLVLGADTSIGLYTLSELLKTWPNSIHVIVNANNEIEARDKIASGFAEYQLTFNGLEQRVNFFLGDVTKKHFGLYNPDYEFLRENTGHVLDLALTSKYNCSLSFYEKLWLPQLFELLDFCGDPNHPKSLHSKGHYTSHFLSKEEDFNHLDQTAWRTGFSCFKHISSETLSNAFNRGLRGCIYDMPMIIGSSQGAISPSCNSAWEIIDIFIKSGYYLKFNLRVSSIDVVAKMISLNLCNELIGEAKSLIRPVLRQFVRDRHLKKYADHQLKFDLQKGSLENIKLAYPQKEKVDFYIPEDFQELLDIAYNLDPIYPNGLDITTLPDARHIFLQGMHHMFDQEEENPDDIYIRKRRGE